MSWPLAFALGIAFVGGIAIGVLGLSLSFFKRLADPRTRDEFVRRVQYGVAGPPGLTGPALPARKLAIGHARPPVLMKCAHLCPYCSGFYPERSLAGPPPGGHDEER